MALSDDQAAKAAVRKAAHAVHVNNAQVYEKTLVQAEVTTLATPQGTSYPSPPF
jgi:hypothetical protein